MIVYSTLFSNSIKISAFELAQGRQVILVRVDGGCGTFGIGQRYAHVEGVGIARCLWGFDLIRWILYSHSATIHTDTWAPGQIKHTTYISIYDLFYMLIGVN